MKFEIFSIEMFKISIEMFNIVSEMFKILTDVDISNGIFNIAI